MLFLKQSTASQSVKLGPFVDSTDGVTAETGLTIANTDIKLSKAGGTMAAKNSGGGTHDADGWYTITLDATDTNTVGSLQVSCKVAGACPVWAEFQVLEEAIYDALIAASASAFDSSAYVKGVSGTLNTLDALDTAQDSQHSSTQALVTTVDTVVDGIQTDLSNGTDGLGAIKTAVDAIPTSNPTAAAIADQVWDEVLSGHLTAGTTGEALNAAGAAGDPWTTTLPGSYTGSQAGKMLSDILTDTAEIGTAGAGLTEAGGTGDHLTAVPWNAAWDAEVQSEVADGLTAYDPPTNTEMVAAFTEIKGATWSSATDTLEHIRNKQTDIEADTQDLQTQVGTAGVGLTNLGGMSTSMKAEVNAEMVDVIATDTYAEPGQGSPAATASLAAKINYLYKNWRNKRTQTATTESLYDDAGTTVDQKRTVSDDGTTATKGEMGTGP